MRVGLLSSIPNGIFLTHFEILDLFLVSNSNITITPLAFQKLLNQIVSGEMVYDLHANVSRTDNKRETKYIYNYDRESRVDHEVIEEIIEDDLDYTLYPTSNSG